MGTVGERQQRIVCKPQPAAIPVDFLRVIFKADRAMASMTLQHLTSPLSQCRLNRSVSEYLDPAVTKSMKGKQVGTLLALALDTEARDSADYSTHGGRRAEATSALRHLMGNSTLVPMARLDPRLSFGTALSGPCHALTYFSTLPGFPRFRHSDREAQNLLIMTAVRDFQDLTHQLLQKALKVDREPVQAWMARICALNKVTRSHPLMPSCLHPFRPLVLSSCGSLHL